MKAAVLVITLFSLAVILPASAKEFNIPATGINENADGNFLTLRTKNGTDGGTISYELVPATTAIVSILGKAHCPGNLRIEGSVLDRHQFYAGEDDLPGNEAVKLLVRNVTCAAAE